VTVVDTTVLPNNELTAEQNKIDKTKRSKWILWCWITGRGAFTQIFHTL